MNANADSVAAVLERLDGVKARGPNRWAAFCPVHERPPEGHKRSLSVTVRNGRVLVSCHAGCPFPEIVKATGLPASAFGPPKGGRATKGARRGKGRGRIVARYPYRDRDGTLRYEAVRYEPKDFRFRRPDGKGGWVWNLDGTPRVLYRLPELLAADPAEWVYPVEGERDADNLAGVGVVATCNPGGAGKWGKLADDSALHGRRVAIIPDHDEAGRRHALDVARRLHGKAAVVKVIELPGEGVKDASDWLDSLDGKEPAELRAALVAMAESAPAFDPATARDASKLDVRDFPTTDSGNAELIVALYGQRLRFDHRSGKWFLWGRHAWREDDKARVDLLATKAARRRYKEAMDLPADDEHAEARKAHAKWARQSESAYHKAAALKSAGSIPPVALTGEEWNGAPMLMACGNGVIDLRTGELRPGRPEDLITFHSPAAYEPRAECPRWLRFLDEVFCGDKALVAFIQRAVGYTLTAATSEQVWFFLWGRGANGKGVLIGTLQCVFGSYAFTLPFSCFEVRRSEATPNDLAALPGRRLVVAAESGDASTFDSAKLKNLTGEDEIAARFLYHEWFHFKPSFKLWLAANRKPRVRDTTEGFWRRCLLIPFMRQFVGPAADKDLKAKLRAEAPGILRWAVEGAGYWLAMGLKPPECVLTATEAYRADNDELGAFLETACELEAGAETGATELYRAYLLWCGDVGMAAPRRMSQTAFGIEMGERFERQARRKGRVYIGLRLTDDMAARVAAEPTV